MPLLEPLTRDQVDPELRPLWDECEHAYPDFRNLWATMAHSPSSSATSGASCSPSSGRAPSRRATSRSPSSSCPTPPAATTAWPTTRRGPSASGSRAVQVAYLETLDRGRLDEDETFAAAHPGFDAPDSLVVDLARFVVWAGLAPAAAGVHPRVVHRLRRRLFDRLAAAFSPRQIEELVWRTTQCAAFNWHNDLLELDLEPEVAAPAVGPRSP